MQRNPPDIEKISKIPMNFVVGKERSGTTLLQVLLNSHPNIVAPPESRFIMLLYHRYGSIRKWTENDVKNFCNDLFKEITIRNLWSIKKDELRAWLMTVKDKLNYVLICKLIYYYSALPDKEVTLFFDKNPIYDYFLPRLEELFPEARFIHIVRDYRAHIVSHRKVFNAQAPAALAYRWIKVNERIEHSKARLGARYFTIKYETLVTEPENCMRQVCKFLDLPYSDNMGKDHTDFMYQNFKNNERTRFKEMHHNLFKPISTVHIDEWKQKLSPAQIAEAEGVAGEYGKRLYGYEITTKPISMNLWAQWETKIKYWGIYQVYKIAFKRLKLYYFIKRKIWSSF